MMGRPIWLLQMTQCMSAIWSVVSAYDGWACSIEVYACRWEILDPVRRFLGFSLDFAINGLGSIDFFGGSFSFFLWIFKKNNISLKKGKKLIYKNFQNFQNHHNYLQYKSILKI
jgi:hypothetical protein